MPSPPYGVPEVFDGWRALYLFVALLGFFHTSEFLLAAAYNRETLGWNSWLISKPYCYAMTLSLFEYTLEWAFFPQLKASPQSVFFARVGLVLIILGELLRKVAMITAGKAFTHLIQIQKRPEHHLVTTGVYAYIRHPGYLGWFWWSVATQVLLCNPLCVVVFAVMSARFFASRIVFEEKHLSRLFGDEYKTYASRTPTYIPLMSLYGNFE